MTVIAPISCNRCPPNITTGSDTPKLSKLLYPFRSHLFFEIGANVLPRRIFSARKLGLPMPMRSTLTVAADH